MADTGFTAWHRRTPRSLWRCIADAPSADECRKLLASKTTFGDRLVLPAGDNPNAKRRR